MKLMLVIGSLALALGACTSGINTNDFGNVDFGNGVDFSYGYGVDFGYDPYDYGYGQYDLAYQQPDFGNNGDFGHHHHHDFGFPEDFGFPTIDFAQPPGVDLSQQVPDLATRPDLGGAIAACETCLQASCSSDVSTCEADPNCVATLSCVVADGCFTYAGGSSSFGSCVDTCVLSQSLTVQQTVAVLGEIGALASCVGSCVDTCGGN